jgi:hypothetical protein
MTSVIFSINHDLHSSWGKCTCHELDHGLLGHAHAQLELISDNFLKVVHPGVIDASVWCSIPKWEGQINGSCLGGGRVGAVARLMV